MQGWKNVLKMGIHLISRKPVLHKALKQGTLRFFEGRVILFKSLTGRDLDKESTRIQC